MAHRIDTRHGSVTVERRTSQHTRRPVTAWTVRVEEGGQAVGLIVPHGRGRWRAHMAGPWSVGRVPAFRTRLQAVRYLAGVGHARRATPTQRKRKPQHREAPHE